MDRRDTALALLRELAKAEPAEVNFSDLPSPYEGVCLFCTPELACIFEGTQDVSGYTYDACYAWVHTGDCLVLKARAYLDAVKGIEK